MLNFDPNAAAQTSATGQPSQPLAPSPADSVPTVSDFRTVDEAVKEGGDSWRDASVNVCRHLIANNECFSSGEVARFLRMVNPNLRFAVSQVGEYIRDNYFQGNLGLYDDGNGLGAMPVQVYRQTQGLFPDRTPANRDVFVYGPDAASALAHDFEVYVPVPGQTQSDVANRDASPWPAQPPAPRTPASVSIGLPTVKVGSDNRLYLPRKVVDAYCSLGHIIDGNTKVYVAFDDDLGRPHALVSFQDNGGKEYTIWQGSGRIAFYPDTDNGYTWNPGDEFTVVVSNDGIIVNLG